MKNSPTISVLIPVGNRQSDLTALYADYKAGLEALGEPYEVIVVLDGPRPAAAAALQELQRLGERLTVVSLTRPFGQSTALQAGFEQSSGEIVVTLPAYPQIAGNQIGKLVAALDNADLAIGHRWPRAGGWFEKLRRRVFHSLLARVTSLRFRDLGCTARAMRRIVLEEIKLYGDQQRFVAVLANRKGFRVREVDVQQAPADAFSGIYRPQEYLRSFLDLFTVFFLARFTQKPLRFFGMIGVGTFGLGVLLVLVLVSQKLFFGQGLADRPALLLSSLLVVLGMQIFALGLLGELIIFTHAREIKDYQVEKVVQFSSEQPAGVPAIGAKDAPELRSVSRV